MVKIKFDLEDYKPSRIDTLHRPETTLAVMRAAKRWLVWTSVKRRDKAKAAKVPYYVDANAPDGRRIRDQIDTPGDEAALAYYPEAVAYCKRHPSYFLGFALGSAGNGLCWQGYDRDGSLDGMKEWEKIGGYVEKSPSGQGFHVIGLGIPFKPYNRNHEEIYSGKRFFTVTENLVSDGPLIDLCNTSLARLINEIETRTETGHSDLATYLDGRIPPGECDNVLTQFHGHAAWAVANGLASTLEAALFMGRINTRLAAQRDKDFAGKFTRMMAKEGIEHLEFKPEAFQDFDDGGPLRLFGFNSSVESRTEDTMLFGAAADVTPPPSFPRISEYLARGELQVLAGPPGAGKSGFVTLEAAAVVYRRADILGDKLPLERAGSVVVVSNEDGVREAKKRAHAAARRYGLNIKQTPQNSWLLFRTSEVGVCIAGKNRDAPKLEQGLKEIEALILARRAEGGDVAVVYIDTLNSALRGLDENKAGEMGPVLCLLENWAKKLNVCLRLIHHIPKAQWGAVTLGNMKLDLAAVRGSSAIVAAARRVLVLIEVSDAPLESEGSLVAMFDLKFSSGQREGVRLFRKTTQEVDTQHESGDIVPERALLMVVDADQDDTMNHAKDRIQAVKYDKKFKTACHKFGDLMAQAGTEGKEGLVFYAPGKKGGKRPEEFLFRSWDDVYATRNNSDPDSERLRNDLIARYSGRQFGEDRRFIAFGVEDFASTGKRDQQTLPQGI